MSQSWPSLMSAIPTPFHKINNENESIVIDYNSLDNLIVTQLNSNIGIVIFGTTGECVTLSSDEKNNIMQHILTLYYDNLDNFIVGIGGNNTDECIKSMLDAHKYGFRKFMATTPYYNKPTQEGLKQHFLEIENYLPESSEMILYNVPGRTGVNLLPSTVQKIVNNSRGMIIGIKEASGNLSQMIQIRELLPNFNLFCGDDGLVIPAMSIGAKGLISVAANVFPIEFSEIIKLCEEKNYDKAFQQYIGFNNFIELLFQETSPSPVKTALAIRYMFNTDIVRLPLVQTSFELRDKIVVFMNKYNQKFYP
jgi:4-hydroxy-tetrahydrodipicolinate synthase